MKYTFFLGAGASKSCAAPLQNELLRDYFIWRQKRNRSREPLDNEYDMERELATFFISFFGIDVDNGDLMNMQFPTFEEVLGLFDLAISRKESFRNFEFGNPFLSSDNRIDKCREYLIMLMASILHRKLLDTNNNHVEFITKLMNNKVLSKCGFVSTNYDLLIDNALLQLADVITDYSINYGFEIQNYSSNTQYKIPLYKIHGSLNWLHCPTCNEITLTPYKKGVIWLIKPDTISERDNIICSKCGTIKRSIIMPPTYFKEFYSYQINQVSHKTEQLLSETDVLFFCGYSFPDADIHIKYLLKRAETNREKQLRIIIANNHPDKKDYMKDMEKIRFERFILNKGLINYTEESFETLINNIEKYL